MSEHRPLHAALRFQRALIDYFQKLQEHLPQFPGEFTEMCDALQDDCANVVDRRRPPDDDLKVSLMLQLHTQRIARGAVTRWKPGSGLRCDNVQGFQRFLLEASGMLQTLAHNAGAPTVHQALLSFYDSIRVFARGMKQSNPPRFEHERELQSLREYCRAVSQVIHENNPTPQRPQRPEQQAWQFLHERRATGIGESDHRGFLDTPTPSPYASPQPTNPPTTPQAPMPPTWQGTNPTPNHEPPPTRRIRIDLDLEGEDSGPAPYRPTAPQPAPPPTNSSRPPVAPPIPRAPSSGDFRMGDWVDMNRASTPASSYAPPTQPPPPQPRTQPPPAPSAPLHAPAPPPPAPRTHRTFAPQKQELQRGDALSDFELSDLIDEGYNFRTYLSRHPALGVEVRLRVVKPETIHDDAAFRQFQQDMERVSYIHHPSLIRVFSVGTEGRWTFVVEENFRSISAQKLLEEHGPLNELQVLAIARQVVQVFPEFHEKGISHRNITPDHLLVNSSGLVKLQGLGMASLCGPDRTHPQRGNPLYVAPEIIQKGSVVDLRADIYSLGASMYHLVTGTPPFSGESPEEIFEKHMGSALVDPRRRRNEISPGMAGLLLHMMEKRPASRHQTAAELLEEIQSILTRTGSGDGRTTQLTSKLLAPFRRNRAG